MITLGACFSLVASLGTGFVSGAAAKVVDSGTETEPIESLTEDFCGVEGLTVLSTGTASFRWRAVPHGPDGNVYYVSNNTFVVRHTNVDTGAYIVGIERTTERDQNITVRENDLLIEVLGTGSAKVVDSSGKLLNANPGQARYLISVPHNGTPTDPSDDGEATFIEVTRESTGRTDDFCDGVEEALTS